jgi:hypothetical protein
MNGTVSQKTGLSKHGKKQSAYRRIVTRNVSGKSVLANFDPRSLPERR